MEALSNERELLERCIGGEMAAYAPIVEAYSGRAYQYALSILRNHHDALDISQQAFARGFRALKSFDINKPFLPWFLRIVRNLCINHLDKRGRQPDNPGPIDGSDVIQFIAARGEGPDNIVAGNDQVEQIRKAVEELPEEHREVIFLRHFEDMTYEEIAEILDIPTGTVMSRLYNGRRKLAEILKSKGLV